MAGPRTKVPPVGSAPWVFSERQQAGQFMEQEVEEFGFAVRNEMDWLNEHMSDIFSRTEMNVAEVFKTPGKLRGKTPRTARKRNALEARAPLADIFSPNSQNNTSPQKTAFYKSIAKFRVAEDAENAPPPTPPQTRINAGFGKENNETRRLMPENLMHTKPAASPQRTSPHKVVSPAKAVLERAVRSPTVEDRRATDESFVSAKEDQTSKNPSFENLKNKVPGAFDPEDMDVDEPEGSTVVQHATQSTASQSTAPATQSTQEGQASFNTQATSIADEAESEDVAEDPKLRQIQAEEVRSPSEGSSPVKLVRKSSLTFASLPAREPLAKKSFGPGVPRTSHADGLTRSSLYQRFTGGKSLGGAQQAVETHSQDHDDAMDIDDAPELTEESEAKRLHNKTSTQRLHDRINMLGQAKEVRPTRVVAGNGLSQQPQYPQLPMQEADKHETATAPIVTAQPAQAVPAPMAHREDDDDDDWIKPIASKTPIVVHARPQLVKSQSAEVMEQISGKTSIGGLMQPSEVAVNSPLKSKSRPQSPVKSSMLYMHSKSASVTAIASPIRLNVAGGSTALKGFAASQPDMSAVLESTTPMGSPSSKRNLDGPLSASKNKFFSVLKSAKATFFASAGISAQAKMEILSPSQRGKQSAQVPALEQPSSPKREVRAAAQADLQSLKSSKNASKASLILPPSPSKLALALSPGKLMEGRRTRSSSEREEKRKEKEAKEKQRVDDSLDKARAKVREEATAHTQSKASRLPMQPSKELPAPPAEEMPPPPPPKSQLPTALPQKQAQARRLLKPTKETAPKQPVVFKVAMGNRLPSHQSGSSSTTSSFADNTTVAPPTKQQMAPAPVIKAKVADTAAKKKELAAQRRAEMKREQEQKRLKQEEERRVEQQRKAAEQRAVEVKKAAAQKQAIEAKQRQQPGRPPSRQANTLTTALQNEKNAIPNQHPRSDVGGARPVSRMNTVQEQARPMIPPVNPAKPPKRVFQPDDDEPIQRPALQRAGPSYTQQQEGKRRKTNELDEEPAEERRSVMKPPIRHSNMRKEQAKFTQGYIAAQTPGGQSLLKTTVTSQHKSAHPHDLAKFSSARIPFGDQPNPPAGPSAGQYPNTYKTPVRSNAPHGVQTAPKSSPHFPASENIELPDIASDSEDEDSENEFQPPSWADSPALRELLSQQQLVDPESVFGPIPPLKMDEIFTTLNEDRKKKLKVRKSSAVWHHDRITDSERKRDREAREKMMREGGWTFEE